MIGAIIQARMGSTRLPEKVIKQIQGKTVLEHTILRVKQIKGIDQVILAIPTDFSNDILEDIGKKQEVDVFRGSEDNVLDRFYQSAKLFNLDHIVRITADCPLLDHTVAEKVIKFYLDNDYDYVSNVHPPTFPDGYDVEVFSFKALEKNWQEAETPEEKEHVWPYFYKIPDMFKAGNFESDQDYSHFRLTLDEEKDLILINKVFDELYNQNPHFGLPEIVDLFNRKPELIKINQDIEALELSRWQHNKNMNKGIQLWNKAKKIIPGGSQLLSKRVEMILPELWPSYYKKGKGIEVWGLDDKKYIDMFYMGIGSCILGYADDDVNKAVKQAVDDGSMTTLNAPEEVELAELLCELHPWASKVRYARTGGEAMAVAVRIARAYTGKDKIAFCGYHGWHDWYLSANLADDKNLDGHLLPGLEPKGVPRGLKGTAIPFHYNKIEELEEVIKNNDIGVIVMEPMRHHEPENGFLEKVRAIADEHNIVLIFDEITIGWRMNLGGVHLKMGVTPDIAVFAKAISNGYPMAAIIGKDKVMEASQSSFISSTYWTERIGPVAALATIKKMKQENLAEHLKEMGQLIKDGWQTLSEKHGLNITIQGSLPLITFAWNYQDKNQAISTLFTQEMLKKGYLASKSVYLSLAHQSNDIQQYLQAVDHTFTLIQKAITQNNIDQLLDGPPAHTSFQRLT